MNGATTRLWPGHAVVGAFVSQMGVAQAAPSLGGLWKHDGVAFAEMVEDIVASPKNDDPVTALRAAGLEDVEMQLDLFGAARSWFNPAFPVNPTHDGGQIVGHFAGITTETGNPPPLIAQCVSEEGLILDPSLSLGSAAGWQFASGPRALGWRVTGLEACWRAGGRRVRVSGSPHAGHAEPIDPTGGVTAWNKGFENAWTEAAAPHDLPFRAGYQQAAWLGGMPQFGSVSDDEIRAEVKSALPALLRCVEDELKSDPDLGGDIHAQLVIAPDGRVASVTLPTDTIGHEGIAECVRRTLLTIQFPSPSPPGIVLATFPFSFHSPE